MALLEPNCNKRKCKYYIGVGGEGEGEENEVNICEAFPNGIPDEIAYGDNDHTKPFKGDNGIRYEKESEKENEKENIKE